MIRLQVFLAIALLTTGCHVVRNPDGTTVIQPGFASRNQASANNAQPPAQNGNSQANAATPEQSPPAAMSADPRQALNQIATYLETQGYRITGNALHNNSLPEGGLVAYALNAQPQRCYVAVAVGGNDTSMRLALVNAREQTVSFSVASRPFVEGCTQSRGRLRMRLQHISGPRDYYYAVFQSNTMGTSRLGTLLTPRGARSATVEPDSATNQRISAITQRLEADGYSIVSEPRGIPMRNTENRDFRLNLRDSSCYAFATVGGAGTRDTDLMILGSDGQEMARDVLAAQDATITDFCPTTSGQYTFRARLYQGNGPVFVAAYHRPSEETPSAEPDSGENTGEVISGESTVGAGLEENYQQRHARILSRGYEVFGEPARGELEDSQHRDFPVTLEGGRCYAILAVGDNGVRNLDLLLHNGSGREFDRDFDTNAQPIVRVCPESTARLHVRVAMNEGAGRFVYTTYRWTSGTRGAWGLAGIMYVRHAELTRILDVDGYEADLDAAPERGRLRRQGDRRTHRVTLEAGQCYNAIAVGNSTVQNLDLRVRRGSVRVASDSGFNAFPAVQFCPRNSGIHLIDVSAIAGNGEYFFQLYRRRE